MFATPLGSDDGVSRDELAIAADRVINDLADGRANARDVLRILYPVAAPSPSDPWWATPLGQILRALMSPGSPSGRGKTAS